MEPININATRYITESTQNHLQWEDPNLEKLEEKFSN